jgi:hypothetical protein
VKKDREMRRDARENFREELYDDQFKRPRDDFSDRGTPRKHKHNEFGNLIILTLILKIYSSTK